MERSVRMRLRWVNLYLEIGNGAYVCRRCGISAPTLRKWVHRFEDLGLVGLQDRSRRPLKSPSRKVDSDLEQLILLLRRRRRIGARRLQGELLRHHETRLSLATIHKVLSRNEVPHLKRPPRRSFSKRYERPIPGERVQMDTCKIAPGLYQFTAVDDCSRYRVLGLYKRRTAANTIDFLEQVIEEMYFPIQRIQTDRGGEFFAHRVQAWLMEAGIKFRPVKPRSPHLNGKVERSQRTDKEEFWSRLSRDERSLEDLQIELAEWQYFYNWHRPHGSLSGKTPVEKVCELLEKTPYQADVWDAYDPQAERLRERDYQVDRQLAEAKRSV